MSDMRSAGGIHPGDMYRRRWMMFVDGENLVARAQALIAEKGLAVTPNSYYHKDVFIWMPGISPTASVIAQPKKGAMLEEFAVRSYYYTSMVGSYDEVDGVREALRIIGFQPVVFKRNAKQRQSKGVDITMTKDMLVHAFKNNYDAAVLVTGDGDYVPVVEELKGMGKSVYVVFFDGESSGLNKELRLACDKFFKLTTAFISCWCGAEGTPPDEDIIRQTTRN